MPVQAKCLFLFHLPGLQTDIAPDWLVGDVTQSTKLEFQRDSYVAGKDRARGRGGRTGGGGTHQQDKGGGDGAGGAGQQGRWRRPRRRPGRRSCRRPRERRPPEVTSAGSACRGGLMAYLSCPGRHLFGAGGFGGDRGCRNLHYSCGIVETYGTV
jgi:hypothetical protein